MRLPPLKKGLWNDAIFYVNKALDTGFYCGDLYWIRGWAYDALGDYRAAKRDYKKGKKLGSEGAAMALDKLKERRKRN